MRDLGQQAVRLLLARVTEPASLRQSLVLPTQLVVRRSCGCPARRNGGGAPGWSTR
jgi:LacI family transcriptional regulator